jgi:uncharacterized membrane protein YphA (DoxX/SURF4 family)
MMGMKGMLDRILFGMTGLVDSRIAKLRMFSPLPLRAIVGYGFMVHGYAKLMRGPDSFIAILSTIGVPAPEIMGWATILIELLGGIAIIAGAFVRLLSVPMAIVLLVAAFTVHLPNGFSSIKLLAMTPSGAQFGQPAKAEAGIEKENRCSSQQIRTLARSKSPETAGLKLKVT